MPAHDITAQDQLCCVIPFAHTPKPTCRIRVAHIPSQYEAAPYVQADFDASIPEIAMYFNIGLRGAVLLCEASLFE